MFWQSKPKKITQHEDKTLVNLTPEGFISVFNKVLQDQKNEDLITSEYPNIKDSLNIIKHYLVWDLNELKIDSEVIDQMRQLESNIDYVAEIYLLCKNPQKIDQSKIQKTDGKISYVYLNDKHYKCFKNKKDLTSHLKNIELRPFSWIWIGSRDLRSQNLIKSLTKET